MKLQDFDELTLSGRLISIVVTSMVVVWVDYVTGPEYSFSLFYLIPVTLVTLGFGRKVAIAAAVVAASIWLLIDLYSVGPRYEMHVHLWNGSVRMGFFLLVVALIAQLKETIAREERNADTDGLTGLMNARGFHDQLEIEYARARRYHHPISLIYIDLDNFKQVNDTQGHGAGDQVLRTVAIALQAHVRGSDFVARLGGDEFAILLPETPFEGVGAVSAQIRATTVPVLQHNGWPVTLSIGAVTFDRLPADVGAIVTRADAVMYQAKREGKDRIVHERVTA